MWDMDGTLVDTEPYWIRAETELIESYGGTWTHEDALEMVGKGLWDSAAIIQAKGVELSADEIVHRLTSEVRTQIEQYGAPWRPGALELLRAAREAGIRAALVTMSIRSMAQDVVDAAGFDAFDLLVTGDEVAEPKPHPAAYLKAADELGVDIADCIAIEDSVTGVTSAHRAGAIVIGVPNVVSLHDAPTDVLLPSLTEIDVDGLIRLASERAAGTAAAENVEKERA
nr:HAD family phosphatase [Agromyces seonyuensis]